MLRPTLLAAFTGLVFSSPIAAAEELFAPPKAEELFAPQEEASMQGAEKDHQPFTRTFGVSGAVSGSLKGSAMAVGLSPSALVDVLHAFATTLDPDHEIGDGDTFHVRVERAFTPDGVPLDGDRVLWAELQLGASKKSVAIYRLRPLGSPHDAFWLASGQGTPILRLPLAVYLVSSGFGARIDPLEQLPLSALGHPLGKGPTRAPDKRPPALGPGAMHVNEATALGLSAGLAPNPGSGQRMTSSLGLRRDAGLDFHEGVDLVAPFGAPVYAAGDGVVKSAEPRNRYGNAIEIDHRDKLATVYGHLSSFAPGIGAGAVVSQGDVIGYVGLTGRTTGPHVHFEVRVKGRPVDPMHCAELKPPQLRGADLEHLRNLVARVTAERERESTAASAGL